MRWLFAGCVLVLLTLLGAMLHQHLAYLDARREMLQDRQPLVYSGDVFHTVTFVKMPTPFAVAALQPFADLVASRDAHLVYAGQAAFTSASGSGDLGRFDAVLLTQFDSRPAWEQLAASAEYKALFDAYAYSYTLGFERPILSNLLIHQYLLLLRVGDALRRHVTPPLQPMPLAQLDERGKGLQLAAQRLRALAAVNDEAVLVFNASSAGSVEQQAADTRYVAPMISRMARGQHGPMHVGQAVILQGEAGYENVALVYYPGANYFADLLTSRFFSEIIGDKQLGENLSVPTVPITDRLVE